MQCIRCTRDYGMMIRKLKDKNGEHVYCPNCLSIAWSKDELDLVNDPKLIDDITGERGAVEFVSVGESYCLERRTMLRLISYNLQRHEYLILANKYGTDKRMIHDDFYWNDGSTLQSII